MKRRIFLFNLALGLLLAVIPLQAQEPAFLLSTLDAFLKEARP